MKSAAKALSCTLRDVLLTQVLLPGLQKMAIIKESAAAATGTSHHSKKDTKKTAQTRLQHLLSELSTAISGSFSKITSGLSPFVFPTSLQLFSPPLSGSVFFRRSAWSHCRIAALVMETSSRKYDEASEISLMIMGELAGEGDENPRLRKKTKVTRKKLSRARVQAPELLESFLSPSSFPADVFRKSRLRENLEAMSLSFLKSFSRLLKHDTSDEESSSFSGSGSDEPSFNRSSGCHQNADLRYTQAVQRKHRAESVNFDGVVSSKPPSVLSAAIPPTTIPSLRTSLLLFFLLASKRNRDRHDFKPCSPFLEQFHNSLRHRSHPYREEIFFFSTLLASHRFQLCRTAYIYLVQHPEEIELLGLCALSSGPLAHRRWAAAIAENHASRLDFQSSQSR